MAKYDPKRPRPTLGDDDPAPVDTLIDVAPDDVEPVAVEDQQVHPEVQDDTQADAGQATKPSAESSAESSTESTAESTADGSDPHVSDVPVIPPPVEGTANRAVLAAVSTGVTLIVAIAVILRLRRRRG